MTDATATPEAVFGSVLVQPLATDAVSVIDAIATDLTTHVTALEDVEVHLYAPWNPEELEADGKRHLAVYPVAEAAETRDSLVGNAHELTQVVAIQYWEPDPLGVRQVEDEDGARALLQLQHAVRRRFYVEMNQMLGGSERVWYLQTTYPERSMQVRWFRMLIEVRRIAEFT